MRSAHRAWHRWIWIVLAPVLAAGLVLALSVRTPVPVEDGAPINIHDTNH